MKWPPTDPRRSLCHQKSGPWRARRQQRSLWRGRHRQRRRCRRPPPPWPPPCPASRGPLMRWAPPPPPKLSRPCRPPSGKPRPSGPASPWTAAVQAEHHLTIRHPANMSGGHTMGGQPRWRCFRQQCGRTPSQPEWCTWHSSRGAMPSSPPGTNSCSPSLSPVKLRTHFCRRRHTTAAQTAKCRPPAAWKSCSGAGPPQR
mmetsp:Transcript_17409/g.52177  ORF Transcript_17409/g.52177 Transcript_17409/m.52177 type:complete len:200 (-) Transcript_17409:2719-3318(-)